MAIFKFYQLNKSMMKVIGKTKTKLIFPEYDPNLSSNMPQVEQIALSIKVMKRMDEELSIEERQKIRRMCSCNIPKNDLLFINKIKEFTNDLNERLKIYSKYHNLVFENEYIIYDFKINRCECGMFKKTPQHDPISKTWCECCNGNVIKTFEYLTDSKVESEMIETISSGDKNCIFKIKIIV